MREQSLDVDPILGLEEVRRGVLRVSKSAFYGSNGIRSQLPVIQLSAKRKGVRRSALDAFLVARTRGPALDPEAKAAPDPTEPASTGRAGR